MLLLQDRLVDVPIMSLQTGGRIARTSEAIIDPRQLKIVAFYCEGSNLDVRPAILNIDDIREIGGLGIIVDSADVLMSPDDLVRLQEIIGFKFKLQDKKVVDESGKKLGTVANYTLDSDTLYIVKLQVRPSAFAAFKTTELIIDRTQIVQVTDSEVVVQSTRTKETSAVKAAHPLAENPFRQAHAEGITPKSQ